MSWTEIMCGGFGKTFSREMKGASTSIVSRAVKSRRQTTIFSFWRYSQSSRWLTFLALCITAVGSGGCGETSQTITSPAAGKVNSYFGGPFVVTGSTVAESDSTFDHSANNVAFSGLITLNTARVPVNIINGSFVSAPTGFLGITEDFATTLSAVLTPFNPPLTGAWAVEIPGAGALANVLSINTSSTPATISAAPTAMADNSTCPNFATAAPFLYVTVPNTGASTDLADYGIVQISSQGSAVTFNAQPYLVGSQPQPPSIVTGGCSQTILGALTAYPLNSFRSSSNLELISIGNSGLLVSSFNQVVPAGGAFGGGKGVIGVAAPGALDVNSVVAAQYNGFIFSPQNRARQSYDITVLASSFGDHSATSQSCSVLQASLTANNGHGANTVPVLPSANSLYGGEFLTMSGSSAVNDPMGASGSENCDVVIDLGTQDSSNIGLFPNATVFIGSDFPPFSASNPWTCGGVACAISFPAAAIVGQVQGKYVILLSASASSNPPAQLPGSTQPIGIYLFQK
jgi:hypothetical protein